MAQILIFVKLNSLMEFSSFFVIEDYKAVIFIAIMKYKQSEKLKDDFNDQMATSKLCMSLKIAYRFNEWTTKLFPLRVQRNLKINRGYCCFFDFIPPLSVNLSTAK